MIADHLWQSTLVIAVIALLAWALRRCRAEIRYWLWVTASIKLLVPFGLLIVAGGFLGTRTHASIDAELSPILDIVTQSMSAPEFSVATLPVSPLIPAPERTSATSPLVIAAIVVWLCGSLLMLLRWWLGWRRIDAVVRRAARRGTPADHDSREISILRRLEGRAGLRGPLRVVHADIPIEPGVFGIIRPTLLWPRSVSARLTDAQIESILAHELCHVRRRDNLFSAVHAAVQVLFWFHPLVWWIGARLIAEREQSCDEEVIGRGGEPQLYAESILTICEHYLSAPIVHMAGVTGSDLKKRIERIMRHHSGEALTLGKKLLLGIVGLTAMVAPIATGAIGTARVDAQTPSTEARPAFEVTSVKINKSTVPRIAMLQRPGGVWEGNNVTLGLLIRLAYQVQDFQIVNGPAWLYSDHFDVLAKRPEGANPQQFPLMMQSLLEDRFKLRTHRETRELPIYALVLARRDGKLGPKLTASTVDCAAIARGRGNGPVPGPGQIPQPGERPQCGLSLGRGQLLAGGTSITQLATRLSQDLGRVVIDKTGLTGAFDIDLKYAADPNAGLGRDLPAPPPGLGPPPATDPDLPSLFTAVEEQLGLKLEAQRGPVDVLVIDGAETPTEN